MQKSFNPQVTYEDRPELSETFSDSVYGLLFDGQTMRIEFCVTRMDPPQPQNTPTARQYPVCRLVLSPNAAVDLYNRLQHIIQALEKDGKITRDIPPEKTIQ